MEYRAIYSGDSLCHGKFKYIDKWRSKTGKWVYKYQDEAKDRIQQLKNIYNRRHRDNIIRPHSTANASQHTDANQWHDTHTDGGLSAQQRYDASVQGNLKTRVRQVYNPKTGKTESRREFQNYNDQRMAEDRIADANDYYHDRRGKLGDFLMDFNDKYGPKATWTMSAYDVSTGQHYVAKYRYNIIGNRDVGVETYTYYDQKKRKKKVRPRSKPKAVRGNNG